MMADPGGRQFAAARKTRESFDASVQPRSGLRAGGNWLDALLMRRVRGAGSELNVRWVRSWKAEE